MASRLTTSECGKQGSTCCRRTVLITGSSGYLGQHLLSSLVDASDLDVDIIALYGSLNSFSSVDYSCRNGNGCCRIVEKAALDLSNGADVSEFISELKKKRSIDVLIHLAAISSPAACERDPTVAMAVNCPECLIDSLPSETIVVFLSTDQVYDGKSTDLYIETDDAVPCNVYGRSKLAFERYLMKYRPDKSVCLRSSIILGPTTPHACRKQTFFQFVFDRLQNKCPTQFYSDEWRSVVYVKDVCKVIEWYVQNAIKQDITSSGDEMGIINMGGPQRVSRVDLAMEVARSCFPDTVNVHVNDVIRSVTRSSLPEGDTPVPPDISMSSVKLEEICGIRMTKLGDMIKESIG